MTKKMLNSDRVSFSFSGMCDGCQEKEYGKEEPLDYVGQMLTVSDLQSTGWPMCPECDEEMWPDALCTVEIDLEKDLTVEDIQKVYKLQNLKMNRDYFASQNESKNNAASKRERKK